MKRSRINKILFYLEDKTIAVFGISIKSSDTLNDLIKSSNNYVFEDGSDNVLDEDDLVNGDNVVVWLKKNGEVVLLLC